MKKYLKVSCIIFFVVTMISSVDAQNRKERKMLYSSQYNYEIEPFGVGQDGTKVFKVWGTGESIFDAIQTAKANAVAACIFKGLTGGIGIAPTPPICTDSNIEGLQATYFEEFFKTGGNYLLFIARTSEDDPGGEDRLKLKRGYKVAIYVQVMYDALRKKLEDDGIAHRLDQGF